MREYMKQQMRDMLATLGRAEAILDSRTKKKEAGDIAQLLEDMQASAMAIGTAIEQVEGDGTQTVRFLEEYCELLWQYMVEEDLKARFCKGRQLAGKRGEICTSLEHEFETRLEIVFLVCRSQVWKQMERFYHLMEEKADCWVLTASYKEVTDLEEGTVMHDESGLIPGAVRPMGFGQYDIRERKPDMVFIDGPYAQQGQLGIQPDYDFMEVRENAGIVLYMPCYEADSQAEEAHCLIPQAVCSDIILVPSGRINEIYVNAMNRLDNGQDMIKKIYVLDTQDVDRALSDVLNKKK
ncbi:hypothetical protein MCJ35_06365 [Enterocloster sp. OA13]|uniref:hypothetical protein n=1 Tax=Enterocloster sp. OA13 TaxID=2914161 RepID=UPI000471CD5A|nr:hypothetical protein [Enterocloster sp. OA13]